MYHRKRPTVAASGLASAQYIVLDQMVIPALVRKEECAGPMERPCAFAAPPHHRPRLPLHQHLPPPKGTQVPTEALLDTM